MLRLRLVIPGYDTLYEECRVPAGPGIKRRKAWGFGERAPLPGAAHVNAAALRTTRRPRAVSATVTEKPRDIGVAERARTLVVGQDSFPFHKENVRKRKHRPPFGDKTFSISGRGAEEGRISIFHFFSSVVVLAEREGQAVSWRSWTC